MTPEEASALSAKMLADHAAEMAAISQRSNDQSATWARIGLATAALMSINSPRLSSLGGLDPIREILERDLGQLVAEKPLAEVAGDS